MSELMQVDPSAVIGTADGQDAETENFNAAVRRFAEDAMNPGFKGGVERATIAAGERVQQAGQNFNGHTSERVQAMRQLTNDTLSSAEESSGGLNGIDVNI